MFSFFIGIELSCLENKLLFENLKSELNNFKMEVRLGLRTKQTDSTAVASMLSALSTDIRNDLASLKKRQDQLFLKQDQIQCTLAGETPPVSNSSDFRSPSGSSILAWSSVPTHTPSRKYQHQPSMTGDVSLHQSIVPPAEATSEYLYGFNDLSSFIDDDPYQSSLSDARSDLGNLLAVSLTEPLPTQVQQPTHQLTSMPRPASAQEMDYPFPGPLVGLPTQQQMSSPFLGTNQELLSTQPVPLQAENIAQVELPPHQSVSPPVGNPSKVELPPPRSVTLQPGNPALPPPRKKKRMELRSEDSGNSAALKDPQGVVRKYPELANVADMGKLACMLARQSYFGDDVLKISTVHGKSPQYRALNPQKLSALLATIHELPEFRDKSKQEFTLLYMPKITTSLSRLCVNLRKMSS